MPRPSARVPFSTPSSPVNLSSTQEPQLSLHGASQRTVSGPEASDSSGSSVSSLIRRPSARTANRTVSNYNLRSSRTLSETITVSPESLILPNPAIDSEVESPSPQDSDRLSPVGVADFDGTQPDLTQITDRPIPPTSWTDDIIGEGFLFKPVRRIHEKHIKLFTSICNRFLCTINDISIRNHFRIPLEEAFAALPCVFYDEFGEFLSEAQLGAVLLSIETSDDPIRIVLQKRHHYVHTSLRTLTPRQPSTHRPSRANTIRYASAYAKVGEYARALSILCEEAPIPSAYDRHGELLPQVVECLRVSNPAAQNPVHFAPTFSPDLGDSSGIASASQDGIIVESEDLLLLLKKSPRYRSTGPLPWSFDLLRKMLVSVDGALDAVSDRFLSLSSRFVSRFTTPGIPVNPLWRNQKAIFIPKKDSDKLRIIKIDNIWVRLAGKALAAASIQQVLPYLSPIQLGVGVSGGIEIAGHTLDRWIDNILLTFDSTEIVALLDVEGAFPRIERGPLRAVIADRLPWALPYYDKFYGTSERMFLGNGFDGIVCDRGLHAGDPMATIFFCLAMQGPLLETVSRVPGVQVRAYIDDTAIMGHHLAVAEFVNVFAEMLASFGLTVNCDKSSVCGRAPILQEVSWCPPSQHSSSGVVYMGLPHGAINFTSERLQVRSDEIIQLCNVLSDISAPYAFQILRICVVTKGTFVIRMLPPERTDIFVKQFDSSIFGAVLTMLQQREVVLSIADRAQIALLISLPIRYGGLGLTALAHIQEAAWVAAELAAERCMRDVNIFANNIPTRTQLIRRHFADYDPDVAVTHEPRLQRAFSDKIMRSLFEGLLEHLQQIGHTAQRALLISQAKSDCSWMRLPNYSAKDVPRLSNHHFIECMLLRLLWQPPALRKYGNQLTTFTCCNHRSARRVTSVRDPSTLYHAFSCQSFAEETQRRHNTVVLLLQNALAALGPRFVFLPLQSLGIVGLASNSQPEHVRPDIRMIYDGQEYYIDVRVIDTTCPTWSSRAPEAACGYAEHLKRGKFARFVPPGVQFVAFSLDINGCFGPGAKGFLDSIHSVFKRSNPFFCKSFYRNVSVAMAQYRASMLWTHAEDLAHNLPVSHSSFHSY